MFINKLAGSKFSKSEPPAVDQTPNMAEPETEKPAKVTKMPTPSERKFVSNPMQKSTTQEVQAQPDD